MTEIELKLQVPPAAAGAVARAVATRAAVVQRVHTVYVDTPDGRLAAAGMALRLRRDGRRWLQTVKALDPVRLARLEHEVPIAAPPRGTLPAIDLSRHAGTPAAALLQAVLGDAPVLGPVFETEMRRTRRLLRVGATRLELALDVGRIRAGGRSLPLCELEFEWRSGPLQGLFDAADRWAGRHGLWLDVRSKAERGALLARGEAAAAPAKASRPVLDAAMPADPALRAIVAHGLAQLLPNAAALAAGTAGPEHLHQLRVALRRLRTALRVLADWSPAVDPAWDDGLAALFDAVGDARDRDALSATLLPALRAAGAPFADWPTPAGVAPDPGAELRRADSTRLLLALMAFAHGPGADRAGTDGSGTDAAAPFAERTRPLLRRLHRQVLRDGERFLELDDEARHRLRRRVKRLRYSVEFLSSPWPAGVVRRTLDRLASVQDVLGRFNDLCVATQAFRRAADEDPRAWFAVGWLTAKREPLLQDAARVLKKLARRRPFWRR